MNERKNQMARKIKKREKKVFKFDGYFKVFDTVHMHPEE